MPSDKHPTVHAPLGPALGADAKRTRPCGRIGGILGNVEILPRVRLAQALGTNPQVFAYPAQPFQSDEPTPAQLALCVLADCDGCRLDDLPVSSQLDWWKVVRCGRLADVRGAFAIAWYDSDAVTHLARDSIGERTLFYAPIPNGLVFASSVRAVLASGLVPRKLNLRAVAAYLSYAYLPGRETLAEGVYELLPGERLSFGPAGLRREQFWTLPAPPLDTAPEDEQARRLRETLETAVRERLPEPGEPVGATLSGGIDSSLVVALARRLHSGPVFTYSVSFGSGYANELPFSSMVANHCSTDHRIVELSPAVVLHHLDDSIALLGDPIGDPLTVPNALLFREAAEQVGMVLNGEGGDPCFGGPKNLPMVLSELYPASQGGQNREAAYLRAHLKCYDDFGALLAEPVRDAIARNPLENDLTQLLRDPQRSDFVARLQAVNIRLKGGHHILPKIDALSFPFGVFPRSPLFDCRVVELSLGIPPRLKLHGSVEKYLLKRAVDDLLPREIIDRPKSGMLVPVEGWFSGPLLPAARERILDGLQPYGLFQRDYLERLIAGKLGGLRPRHGAKTWLLVTLEAWLRCVLQQ